MTVQERIDNRMTYPRFCEGNWREADVNEIKEDYGFVSDFIDRLNIGCKNRNVACFKNTEENKTYHLFLFSEKYEYSIVVKPSYIGCVMSCRYKRPLEHWTRGNDLPDGECCKETLESIVYAILRNELIPYDDGTEAPYIALGDEEDVVDEDDNDETLTEAA